jgi:cytoskeleton-associated protein 5
MVATQQPSEASGGGLTQEGLPAALTDKNWKTRVEAFELLATRLEEITQGAEPTGNIDANSVVDGLDDLIPTLVQDVNAGALDKALLFALLYADHCQAAGTADQASRITLALVKKNAFSSRPGTLKLASALTIKLMEVGSDGASSVHSVVEALLSEGLASKKPKVVLAASLLLLEAAHEFGASHLPLASIISSAPKMLVHSNANVRDCGVKIVAEICRTLGSKAPLQNVVDGMKKAQLSELDTMLSNHPGPSPPGRALRSQGKVSDSTTYPADTLAALETGTKELEAERFAARPAVNLPEVISKSEYASKINLLKWSEKVAALKIVLECGGETPYKLSQPSPAVNYAPLISEMKKLLSHTHFAVVSKAMEVLSMLATGVGEKLYSHFRPMLTTLLQLSKDKKLNRAVAGCLDAIFGNILGFEHLLEPDDALPSSLDERTQKNALARSSTLDFLGRCVARETSAGPRGHLSLQFINSVGQLCVLKLDDSDATVRKASLEVIRLLQGLDSPASAEAVNKILYSLKSTHSRAFKALSKDAAGSGQTNEKASTSSSRGPVRSISVEPKILPAAVASKASKLATRTQAAGPTSIHKGSSPEKSSNAGTLNAPNLDEASAVVVTLRVPQWDAPENDGGVLAGLEGKFVASISFLFEFCILSFLTQLKLPRIVVASKWLLRQDAIKGLTAFVDSGGLDSSNLSTETKTSALLVIVKEHTRGFKETNVNIMKAILLLFAAVCDYHESVECRIEEQACHDSVAVAVTKISDKKLSTSCKDLLTKLCVVSHPCIVVSEGFKVIKSVKSPVAHEEYMSWFSTFCNDFGAASLGLGISEIVPSMIDVSNEEIDRSGRQTFSFHPI